MQVHAGSNAVKILQQFLSEVSSTDRLGAIDGIIGPKTLSVLARVTKDVGNLADVYGVRRRDYYFGIADRNPRLRKYVRTRKGGKGGWIRRAEEFMAEKLV